MLTNLQKYKKYRIFFSFKFKITVFYFHIFKNLIYLCIKKAKFSEKNLIF